MTVTRARLLRRVAYCALAALITVGSLLYYRQRFGDYEGFSHAIDPTCKATYCDFVYFYYKQAQQILASDVPVKKYYYSPTFALFLVPIARLSLDDALVAWTWLQALSLLVLVVASGLLLRPVALWQHALLWLLTLTCYPVLHNWKWGQANTTFMALIVLGLALSERGLAKSGALALSAVVASRYFPAMYALALLASRRYKAFAWCVVYTVLLLVALPVLAMGAEHAQHFYVQHLATVEHAYGYFVKSRGSAYLPSTALRLSRMWQNEPIGTLRLWVSVSVALACCNAMMLAWAAYKRVYDRTLWSFAFIALSTPLIAPTSWIHYFVYLPLVQTFLVGELVRLRGRRVLRTAGFLVAWLPSTSLSSVFFFEHTGGAGDYAVHGYLLLSDLLLLALAYLLAPLCWARELTQTARYEASSSSAVHSSGRGVSRGN